MNCPYCNNENTKVSDSRDSKDGSSIKRRRTCISCDKKFVTIEKILKLNLEVEKQNKKIEDFDLKKIKNSIIKACDKRKITLEDIDTILEIIMKELKNFENDKMTTSEIGNVVLKNLKNFDEIAFLKYAIVHNRYENINAFSNELNKLKAFDSIKYGKKQIEK